MAEPKVHNLIIVMTSHSGHQAIANLTIAEPGAGRLFNQIASVSHLADPEAAKLALRQGFSEIDTVVVNNPEHMPAPVPASPPDHDPPIGRPIFGVYHDDMIALAHGEKVVLVHDGDPLVATAEEAVDIDAGRKHVYRDLETGNLEIRDGDGKPTDLGDPATDGSAAGEKHTSEQNPAGT